MAAGCVALTAATLAAMLAAQPPEAPGPSQTATPAPEAAAPTLAESAAEREREKAEMRSLLEADLETLLNTPVEVSTATKTVQKSYTAPAIITTVTRDQIAVWGYRTVAELLDHVLGFFVVDDYVSPNLAVRGSSGGLYAESSVVKVLIDGHSAAFLSTSGNPLGPELVPLSAIDRVEIIRGPGSALYGADAFLGVINILTRDGRSVDGATALVSGGATQDHLTSDIDLAAGGGRGILDVLVAFRHQQQDLSGLALPATSPRPSVPGYNQGATQTRGLDQASTVALAKVTVRRRPGSELGAVASYSTVERGAELGTLFQLANGYDARGVFSENRISRWQARAGLSWDELLGANVRLSLRSAYLQGGPKDDNRLEVGSAFVYVRRQFGYRGLDSDGHVEWAPHPSLRFVGGASGLVDDEALPSRIGVAKQLVGMVRPGDVVDTVSVRQGHKTFVNGGAYLQGNWNPLGDALGVTGGLRFDHHNVYGDQLSRRVGVVSSPTPHLHLKLLHGSAFKAPSPLLLYAVPSAPGDVIGNPQLKPQYVNTFELQVGYDPTAWLSLSTDVAYSILDDKTEFIEQEINVAARNVARATTVSSESLVEVRPRDWLHGYLSFELQRTTQRTGQQGYPAQVLGTEGSIYPRLMLHAGVAAQPPRSPVRAAVQASYVGRRRASENNILLNGSPYWLPSYVLLEAKLATRGFHILRDPAQEISFAVSGKNLLGAAGPNPGFSGVDYPLPPRALFLEVDLVL